MFPPNVPVCLGMRADDPRQTERTFWERRKNADAVIPKKNRCRSALFPLTGFEDRAGPAALRATACYVRRNKEHYCVNVSSDAGKDEFLFSFKLKRLYGGFHISPHNLL